VQVLASFRLVGRLSHAPATTKLNLQLVGYIFSNCILLCMVFSRTVIATNNLLQKKDVSTHKNTIL